MKDVMDWLRTVWPIVALVIILSIGGMQKFHEMSTRLAVVEADYKHVHEKLDEISQDIKDMKNYLMNPTR